MNKNTPKYTMPHDGYVRLPAVLAFLSISKTTFYTGIREGLFPAPIKLTKRTSVWSALEIRQLADKK